MNVISGLIFRWYFFLTLLALFASITIPFSSLISGLFLTWLIFIFFFLGSYLKTFSNSHFQPLIFTGREMRIPLNLVALGTIFASVYAAKFYTGKTVFEIFSTLQNRGSLYNQYQAYFIEHNLALFTLSKIPAVLSLFYLKIASLYGFIFVIVLSKKIAIKNCFYLLIIIGSAFFFSIARGTSFEIFELLLLLWFCMIMRSYILNKGRLTKKAKFLFIMLAVGAVSVYSYNISARYSFHEVASCATYELCMNEDTLLYQVSIMLAKLSFKMSGYFTFGIFYTSKFIEEFCLSSFSHFFSLLIPFADIYNPELTSTLLCNIELDCGAAWVPDVVNYILHIGVIVLLIISFWLGFLTKFLLRMVVLHYSFLEVCALYYIFFAFVSLPVGNFIAVSSANKLSILFVIIGLIFNRYHNFKRIKSIYEFLIRKYTLKGIES